MSSETLWIGDDDEITEDIPMAGVCQRCGCTDAEGCERGCVWVSPAANLCSRCAREDEREGEHE